MRRYIRKKYIFDKKIYDDKYNYKNSIYRDLYDRYELSKLLEYKCGIGITPESKVIIKPKINLLGMGISSEICVRSKSICENLFWCEFFEGEHISSDYVLKDGKILFNCNYVGIRKKDKINFDYWELLDINVELNDKIKKYLKNYSGFLNVETINNKIIECHLRVGDIYLLSKIKDSLENYMLKYEWKYRYEFRKFYLVPIFSSLERVNIYVINEIYILLNRYQDNISWFYISYEDYYGVFRFVYYKIDNIEIGLKLKCEIKKLL